MCLVADNNEEYQVKVHGVVISPDPIVTGQPATFSISANTGTHSLHMTHRSLFVVMFCSVKVSIAVLSVAKLNLLCSKIDRYCSCFLIVLQEV